MSQFDSFSLHFCHIFIIFTVFINSITALSYKVDVMVYNIWLLFYYFEFYVVVLCLAIRFVFSG